MSLLGARLSKLERSIPAPEKRRRVMRIVAAKGDEAGAQNMLDAEGYDPDAGDFAIITYIVSPAGQEPWSEPPYVMDRRRPSARMSL